MSDDLRQRYAEALAAKFTEPVYRCDRDGENERVEKPEPADRIGQTPYVMVTAGDGCRSFWTPSCAELAEVVAAVRDEEMERLREAEATIARVRQLADVYELNAETATRASARNWFDLVAGELRDALDPPPDLLDEEETGRHDQP
ncbi:hypothetical protein [Nonomuraea wenchangensis]|uniref:Uncharacterized protein n=1 Tax=Nonomuraea wenchangensis TaxID=568860 RepID=A0A1I0EXD5_9ACTN|nr:hypothetical protein [Nonomuraea wenchangensis]SET50178.1 hypothetical protein SAMN05421811_103243 [Nonomuraea wenchangensis]